MKFLNRILNILKWAWARPEMKEALTALQQGIWIECQSIAFQAIAEAKAGNFTSGEEKRQYAIKRITDYLTARAKAYPKSVISWLVEHAYQRFSA